MGVMKALAAFNRLLLVEFLHCVNQGVNITLVDMGMNGYQSCSLSCLFNVNLEFRFKYVPELSSCIALNLKGNLQRINQLYVWIYLSEVCYLHFLELCKCVLNCLSIP